MTDRRLSAALAGAALLLQTTAQAGVVTIDFDAGGPGDPDPAGLTAGTTTPALNTAYASLGITFAQTKSASAGKQLMLFDTDCSGDCSGKDNDLGVQQGLGLIVSEDNDASDPDDNARPGGTIEIRFARAVDALTHVGLADIESPDYATLSAYDADGAFIKSQDFANGDGLYTEWTVTGFDGVARLELDLRGSGMLAGFSYTTVPVPAALPLFCSALLGLAVLRRRA